MFGTLYEPPSLTFSGLFLLFAIQLGAIFFYHQAKQYYRNQQLYAQYSRPSSLASSTVAVPTNPGPAGPAK